MNLWSRFIAGAALVVGLTFATGSPAQAAERDYRNGCRQRLEADRARIDRDARRHGERSRQVDRDIARMDSDRQWCRSHRADWDHNRFDIGIYLRH